MIKGIAVKASLCATALLLSLSYGVTAKAATSTSDKGIAGITPVLDNYFTATADKKIGEAEKLLESLSKKTATELSVSGITKVESPYANLGISVASDNSYVNIRSKPSQDSKVVGKLYPGCAADILETKGEWVKIHSGNVDGYINSEFLAIGEEAEKLIDDVASKYAVVNTETLRVREGKGTDTDIVALIPQGEKYYIVNEYDEWVEILIDEDESEEGGSGKQQITGFVSKDLINISIEFEYAISIKEEQAKLKAEEAAKKAEADQLEALAQQQEEERQKEAQDKQASENTAKESEQAKNDSSSSSDSSSSNNNNNNSSSSSSGGEIANYALNFVGNPYVYGGTSLTGGTDCSGFVQSIYSHFGYGIARTSSSQSQSSGVEVSFSNLQAGDLIFYRNGSGSVSHVALYIGGGKVVHASNERDGIKVSNYDYRTPYKARRIL